MAAVAIITGDAIRRHLETATSRSELLRALGVATAARNYERLERIAAEHGLILPAKNQNGCPGARPHLRTSALWDEDKLRAAIVGARSLKEVAANLGLGKHAATRLRRAAEEFGVELPVGHGGPDPAIARAAAIERVFKKGMRRINGERLRRYILDLGVMPYECGICGQPPEWNGKELVLPMDHINGDPTDNRLENLRFLCPNCHSQTETFAGRNIGRATLGNGVIGNTPGSDPGDGHARPGSNPGSPATLVAA
jgi:hypothetical protein